MSYNIIIRSYLLYLDKMKYIKKHIIPEDIIKNNKLIILDKNCDIITQKDNDYINKLISSGILIILEDSSKHDEIKRNIEYYLN